MIYNLVWHFLAQRFVSLPVLLLTVPVAVVDPLVAARALVRGDLAADGTRARVVRDLLYTAHYY